MEEPNHQWKNQAEIIKVLLQDTMFLNDWKQVSDALDIPAKDLFTVQTKLSTGNATMYEVIKWMLDVWKGRKGNQANLPKLIEILENEKLQNAAGEFYVVFT